MLAGSENIRPIPDGRRISPMPDGHARECPRDPRLDFFRGAGMFIILIAHIPWNGWAEWIPARFGFSDATEIFVFCSGVASAIAFGRVFEGSGWLLGTARIGYRIWQVYWVHVGVFVAVLAALSAAELTTGVSYLRSELNLGPFLDDPARQILGLVTLTYVPNYFDILPMYLVILALIPAVMAAARIGRLAVAVLVGSLWMLAWLRLLELPAESWSGRAWFFNPFSWQLVFFLGFAFGRGWLIPPAQDHRWIAAAIGVLALSAPFSCHFGWSCHAGFGFAPWLGESHQSLSPWIDKTHLGPLRVIHFLALAYLAHGLAGDGGRRLKGRLVDGVMRVGQQTMAVFVSGLVLAQVLGVVLDQIGRSLLAVASVNLLGCAGLFLVATSCQWFKSSPWLPPRPIGRTSPLPVEAHRHRHPAPDVQRPAA
jgi:hypothetical protein